MTLILHRQCQNVCGMQLPNGYLSIKVNEFIVVTE